MERLSRLSALMGALGFLALPLSLRADEVDAANGLIQTSVVKVIAIVRGPDVFHPWLKQAPTEESGTGVVIEGKRILTNAHVVLYANQVVIELPKSSLRIAATVEAVSSGMDLAVLKLEDESFFEKRPPLPRSSQWPSPKDAVKAYGYPSGASTPTLAQGVISHIQYAWYFDNTRGIRFQLDATIKPGDSGGPVLHDGKMIGLVYGRLTTSDKIGFVIPSEEIELFLKDIADGKYDGKPDIADVFQALENEMLRSYLKLKRDITGVVVHAPDRTDEAYPLRQWDVVTKIGDFPIENSGLVKVPGDFRVSFRYLAQKLAVDGKLPITIVRKGETKKVELPVGPLRTMLMPPLSGRYPSYFVYGPLVFSPACSRLRNEFMRINAKELADIAPSGSLLIRRDGDRQKFPEEELVVVASQMLSHPLSRGYTSPYMRAVEEINGIRIKNLHHLVEILRDTREDYVSFSFDDRTFGTMILDRSKVMKAMDDILSDNSIRKQGSDDVMEVWTKQK